MTTDLIPLSEASRMLGLGVTTIRSWCQLGKVDCKRSSNAQWLINLDSARALLATSKPGASAGHRMALKNTVRGKVTAEAQKSEEPNGGVSEEHVRDLREALTHERKTSDELRAQNRELQSQLVKLSAEMQALLSRETDGMLSRWFRK
jgi:predicted site-specific integrase-resolvase